MTDGYNNASIGEILGVDEKTVEVLTASICANFDLPDSASYDQLVEAIVARVTAAAKPT